MFIHNIEHYVQPHYVLVNNIMFTSGKDHFYIPFTQEQLAEIGYFDKKWQTKH